MEEIPEAFATIQRIVERGQERGELRQKLDPRLVSWIFYGALEELLTGWVLGELPDGDEEVSRAERTIVDVVCGGLAAAGPAYRRRHARTVVILGLGAFGLAWSLTTTAAYLPPLLGQFTGSTTLIALVLAAEGLRGRAPARDRPVERHVPHAARPAAAFMLSSPSDRSRSVSRCWVLPSLWTMALSSSPSSSPTTSTSRPTGVSTRTS